MYYTGNDITEARARIHDSDGGDKMVKKGSNIELNCTVESGDRAYNSLAVFWYLNDRAMDWQGQTGPGQGVEVSQLNFTNLFFPKRILKFFSIYCVVFNGHAMACLNLNP